MNPNRVNLDALGVSISAAVPRISIPPVPSALERLNASPFGDLSRTLASLQKAASPLAALAAKLEKFATEMAAMGRALRVTGDPRERSPKDSYGRGYLRYLVRRAWRRRDLSTFPARRTRRQFATPKPHGRRDQRPARDHQERAAGRVRQPRAPGFGSAQSMTRTNPRGSP